MKITEALLAEHLVFHNLFDRVELMVPGFATLAEARTCAALMAAMLKDHSIVEDELLMHPLEHCLSQLGQTDNFHHEHEAIEHSLAAAQATRRLASAKKELLKAVHGARQHFDKEERIIFPLAERQLNAKTQAALSQRWEERRKKAAQ